MPGISNRKQASNNLFSVKIVDNQCVLETDNDSAVQEDLRVHYHTCLNDFERALVGVNEKGYDRDIISQLLLSNTRLTLCVPNRRIRELELDLAPLRYQLAAHQYILGTPNEAADEPNQQAAAEVTGEHIHISKNIPYRAMFLINRSIKNQPTIRNSLNTICRYYNKIYITAYEFSCVSFIRVVANTQTKHFRLHRVFMCNKSHKIVICVV